MAAFKHFGTGFPPDEGRKLAQIVLSHHNLAEHALTIDLQECSAGLLVGGFFNGFLQHIFEQRPDLLDRARSITWELAHDFQRESVARWMKSFVPYKK